MLADLGHSVNEANSAERAIKILEGGEELDLVVTDHAMPGMTGMELAKSSASSGPDCRCCWCPAIPTCRPPS